MLVMRIEMDSVCEFATFALPRYNTSTCNILCNADFLERLSYIPLTKAAHFVNIISPSTCESSTSNNEDLNKELKIFNPLCVE